MARVVAEGGFGVARDVAGSGIGVARDVAGNALTQLLALRANGAAVTDAAPSRHPRPRRHPQPTARARAHRPRHAAPAAATDAAGSARRGLEGRRAGSRGPARSPTTTSCRRRRWSNGSTDSTVSHSMRSAATKPTTAGATRSSARSRSSADVESSRPASAADIPRIVELARSRAHGAVGHARRRAVGAARGLAGTARRRVRRRCCDRDDALLVVGSIDDVIVGYGAVARGDPALGSAPRRDHRSVRGRRGARESGSARRWSTRSSRTARAHDCLGIDARALPGHRATKNFFEAHGFTARVLVMHHRLDPDGSSERTARGRRRGRLHPRGGAAARPARPGPGRGGVVGARRTRRVGRDPARGGRARDASRRPGSRWWSIASSVGWSASRIRTTT